MFIYHYHAIKQLRIGEIVNIDGIAHLERAVLTMGDYTRLKDLIAGNENGIGGTDGMTVCSLTLLHETPNAEFSGAGTASAGTPGYAADGSTKKGQK